MTFASVGVADAVDEVKPEPEAEAEADKVTGVVETKADASAEPEAAAESELFGETTELDGAGDAVGVALSAKAGLVLGTVLDAEAETEAGTTRVYAVSVMVCTTVCTTVCVMASSPTGIDSTCLPRTRPCCRNGLRLPRLTCPSRSGAGAPSVSRGRSRSKISTGRVLALGVSEKDDVQGQRTRAARMATSVVYQQSENKQLTVCVGPESCLQNTCRKGGR